MKFVIDIPEELIQKRLDYIATYDKKYGHPHFDLQRIIDNAIMDAIKEKLSESFELPEGVKRVIDAEIEKAAALKIPGWAKRRMKEMLEAVRLFQINPSDGA